MLAFLGIALCVFLILMAVWLLSAAAGIRRLRGLAILTIFDLALAIALFGLADHVGATILMVMATLLLGVCALLLRRLRPRPHRAPAGLSPNGPLGIHDPEVSRAWHALHSDLGSPGPAGHRRGRRRR